MPRCSVKLPFPPAPLLLLLFLLPGCTSQTVNLVHPQSGATSECSGSGWGFASAWLTGYIDDCIRRAENRGYVPLDKLTPEQRLDLQNRGLLPKDSGTGDRRS
jgi:hypothetical protein